MGTSKMVPHYCPTRQYNFITVMALCNLNIIVGLILCRIHQQGDCRCPPGTDAVIIPYDTNMGLPTGLCFTIFNWMGTSKMVPHFCPTIFVILGMQYNFITVMALCNLNIIVGLILYPIHQQGDCRCLPGTDAVIIPYDTNIGCQRDFALLYSAGWDFLRWFHIFVVQFLSYWEGRTILSQ